MVLSVGGLITSPWLFSFFFFFATKSRCVRLTRWLCSTMWAKQQYYACRENMAYDIFIQHLVENLGGTPSSMWGFKISTAKILVILSYPATAMVPKMHLYLRPSMVSLNLVFEDTYKWNFSFSLSCEMPQIQFWIPTLILLLGYKQKWNKCWNTPFLENDKSLRFTSNMYFNN